MKDNLERHWGDDVGFTILLLLGGLVVTCLLIGTAIYFSGGWK